uniref:Uncharacterized protein n=1 Tax=Anopheles maculatus TaxID=74869 RepID=A0A182SDZ7_9DIPT
MPWNTSSGVQPKKAASAELSFAGQIYSIPVKRHQSLPRRLLGSLKPERDASEESEQMFLKQLLKEHGLYNKHQTIHQRRRLKQLLEQEYRVSNNALAAQAETDRPTGSIELHSMPNNPEPLRRGSSLSAVTTATDGKNLLKLVTLSLPTFTH